MSTQQASVEPGKKRATELVDAFRTNTNDALLFVARYGNQAKVCVLRDTGDMYECGLTLL